MSKNTHECKHCDSATHSVAIGEVLYCATCYRRATRIKEGTDTDTDTDTPLPVWAVGKCPQCGRAVGKSRRCVCDPDTDRGAPRVMTIENKFDTDTDTDIAFQCPRCTNVTTAGSNILEYTCGNCGFYPMKRFPPTPTAGTQQTCAFCSAPIPTFGECNCPGAKENRASLPYMDEPDDFPEAVPAPTEPEVQDVTGELYRCTNCKREVRVEPISAFFICRDCGHTMHIVPTKTPSHKTPFHLADLDFLAAMCDNYHTGIKDGRTANGWKNMKWTQELEIEYIAKILRHLRDYVATGDPAHLAAIACNANIIWHHRVSSD